jgi:hypothetical protein
LGRCHARLGDHTLSVAALDAALDGTKKGKLLFSEALTVRARALVGKAATTGAHGSGSSLHWDEHTGKQRLAEMMGRMDGGDSGGELLEKLLLHGI